MKNLRKIRLLAALLSCLIAFNSYAQAEDEATPSQIPDLNALESDWWSYFALSGEDASLRLQQFTDYANDRVGELPPQNQDTARSILTAIQDNVTAFVALQESPDLKPKELPEPYIDYSLDELLSLAATARDASETVQQEQLEVEREQRILDGATRRRDRTFKSYFGTSDADERILTALRLIHDRSSQALSSRRLDLLCFDKSVRLSMPMQRLSESSLRPRDFRLPLRKRVSLS